MIKKLLLVLFLLIGLISFQSVRSAEIDLTDEEMQKAISAYKTGVSLTRAKAYDSAIEAFQKALAIKPDMTDAYYNIASIYIAQNKYDEAYIIYTKILAINPHDYDSILQAAKIS